MNFVSITPPKNRGSTVVIMQQHPNYEPLAALEGQPCWPYWSAREGR